MLADQPRQFGGVAMRVRPGDHQRGSAQQRQEELPDRDVEGGRGLLQHAVVCLESIVLAHPQQAVDDGAVFDDHALGLAGRTGRIDHVGRIVRCRIGPRCGKTQRSPLLRRKHWHAGHACRYVRRSQNAYRLCRGENTRQALVRMGKVNGR